MLNAVKARDLQRKKLLDLIVASDRAAAERATKD